jgi:dipeptidase
MRNYLPDPVGGVLWFGVDDARFTVYTPMYACITKVPESYRHGNGDFTTFSWTSAFWIHNWVANMAYNRYDQMITDVFPAQARLEDGFFAQQVEVEKRAAKWLETNPDIAVAMLTKCSEEAAQEALTTWKSLGEYLLVKYIDGCVKKEADGQFIKNPNGGTMYPNRPKWDADYLREIVRQTGDWLEEKAITF